jgi:glycosyl transferase family 11
MRNANAPQPRVTVQILGGLGNQMFTYATARRLALHHDAELILDTTSRLVHDSYKRRYVLDRFKIAGTILLPSQGTHFGWRKTRRSIMRRVAKRTGGLRGRFLFDLGRGFQPALLEKPLTNFLHLDGTWQDPRYFEDVEEIIREDFQLAKSPPADVVALGQSMRADTSSVSVHLRSYSEIPNRKALFCLENNFLAKALARLKESVPEPSVYVFTDNTEWATQQLQQAGAKGATIVDVNANRGDEGAVLDMWLMSQCHAHIISNSTFGWWGAWLDPNPDKLVIAPACGLPGNPEAIPHDWVRLS